MDRRTPWSYRRSAWVVAALVVAQTVGLAVLVIASRRYLGTHRDMSGWAALGVALLPLFLVVPIFALWALAMVVAVRRRYPAAFVLGKRAFLVRVTPQLIGLQLTIVSLTAIGILGFHPDVPLGARLGFGIPSGAVFLLLGGAVLWMNTRAVLRPEGMTVHGFLFGSRYIPWDALAAGGPLRPGSWGWIGLAIERPDLVTAHWPAKRSRQVTVWAGNCVTEPAFVADTIRYYVEHPEYRERIGQPGEQERLREAIVALPADPPTAVATG